MRALNFQKKGVENEGLKLGGGGCLMLGGECLMLGVGAACQMLGGKVRSG